MQPTAESIVSGLWPLLPFAAELDISPQFGRVLNSKKVSDHHAIIPTMEFVQKGFDGPTEGEKKLLSLVCCKLLCAVAAPHVFEAVTATFTCAGNEFTSKGKTILTPGWKEIDRRFRACFKADADAPELARELPEITEGQTFDKVEAPLPSISPRRRNPTPRTRFCRLWNGPGPRICRRTPSGRDWEPRPPAPPS